jgi:hypothetical protein
VFWNVDPDDVGAVLTGGRLDDLLAGQTPSPGPGAAQFLGAERVAGQCEYDLRVSVPEAPPGTYHVAVFEIGGGGAAQLGGTLEYTVAA